MEIKVTRGGKRKGSGPKPRYKRMVSLSVRLPSAVSRKLKEDGAARTIVELAVDRWPELKEQLE